MKKLLLKSGEPYKRWIELYFGKSTWRTNFSFSKCSHRSFTYSVKPAPDLEVGPRGPGPGLPTKRGPHHVHMFSRMCDICVPLNPFYRGKFVCRRY